MVSVFNFDEGIYNKLIQDDDVMYELKLISCKIDVSKYINPKMSLFFRIIKMYYTSYQMNNIKKEISNNIKKVDENKIIDLEKKYSNI